MKKKTIAILLALMLLAGCDTAPASDTTPDIEAIVQQSVDEALAQYEEAQKAKDAEIADLKAKLEELASQAEESPDDAEMPEESPTPEDEKTPDLVSGQPEEPEPQPEPEEPAPIQTSTTTTRSYDGFDLKNLYPAFIWENFQPIEEDSSSDDTQEWVYETEWEDEYEEPARGTLLEDDALEVIRLTNLERENHGLNSLEIDDDLMALAEIRAEEASTNYSHERPDGTRVSQMGYYGENLGAKASAEKQITSWMNSDSHRANILREGYHKIGVGCYLAENGKHYWIQVFSK